MDLDLAMRTTPATREFTDEAIPRAVVHRILDRARFAPSGGNRQPWHVIVVEDAEQRRALRDLYALGWREYVAHVGAGLVPFAPREDGRWPGPAVDLEQARATPAPNQFGDGLDAVPVMLILCVALGALAVLDNGLDRQSIVGGGSIYPFGHNILLSARSEGLGGVLTTVICRQEPGVRALLRVPETHAVAGLVALGVPVKHVTKLRRQPVEAFTTLDIFDGTPFEQ